MSSFNDDSGTAKRRLDNEHLRLHTSEKRSLVKKQLIVGRSQEMASSPQKYSQQRQHS